MIVDASAMPSRMAREAFFLSILRSDAMSKKRQTEKFGFLDPVRLAKGSRLKLFDNSTKMLRGTEPVKNLLDKKENERNRQNIADRRKEQRLPQGQHKKTRKRNAAAQFNERQHRDQRHEKLRGQKAQICLKPINYYLQI